MEGCSAPLVVKFADTQKDKEQKKIHHMQATLLSTLGTTANTASGLSIPNLVNNSGASNLNNGNIICFFFCSESIKFHPIILFIAFFSISNFFFCLLSTLLGRDLPRFYTILPALAHGCLCFAHDFGWRFLTTKLLLFIHL